MAKKNVRSANLHPSEIADEITSHHGWIATMCLEATDHVESTMSSAKLLEAKLLFKSNVIAVVPDPCIEVDWFKEGWVCLYYYPFELGLTFPFPDLVVDVLRSMKVSPGQLMPSAWRILACLNAIESKYHLGINVDVIKHSFSVKKLNGCRFSFVSRKNDEPLILNNETVNDRGWKNEFFFAEKASLGENSDYIMEHWTTKSFSSFLSGLFV